MAAASAAQSQPVPSQDRLPKSNPGLPDTSFKDLRLLSVLSPDPQLRQAVHACFLRWKQSHGAPSRHRSEESLG